MYIISKKCEDFRKAKSGRTFKTAESTKIAVIPTVWNHSLVGDKNKKHRDIYEIYFSVTFKKLY